MSLNYNIRCCSKCGNIDLLCLKTICKYCNSPLIDTEFSFIESVERGNLKPEIRKAIFEKYIKDNLEYSEEAVKDREEQEKYDRLHMPSSGSYSSQNKPKCPTCQSTNIQKLSTTSKVLGVGLLGLASKTVGKTYKCKNCGHHW